MTKNASTNKILNRYLNGKKITKPTFCEHNSKWTESPFYTLMTTKAKLEHWQSMRLKVARAFDNLKETSVEGEKV